MQVRPLDDDIGAAANDDAIDAKMTSLLASQRWAGALPEDTSTPPPQKANQADVDLPEQVLAEQEVRSFEREDVCRALVVSGGNVYGDGGSAELLGIKPTTLLSRMRAFEIRRRARDWCLE